jgi:hypothetical protein
LNSHRTHKYPDIPEIIGRRQRYRENRESINILSVETDQGLRSAIQYLHSMFLTGPGVVAVTDHLFARL